MGTSLDALNTYHLLRAYITAFITNRPFGRSLPDSDLIEVDTLCSHWVPPFLKLHIVYHISNSPA